MPSNRNPGLSAALVAVLALSGGTECATTSIRTAARGRGRSAVARSSRGATRMLFRTPVNARRRRAPRSIFTREAKPAAGEGPEAWNRFASTWEEKWHGVDEDHVVREVLMASGLQLAGEVCAELLLGYDVSALDWNRIAIRSVTVGLWYGCWMSRYLHALDAVKEVAPDSMGPGTGKRGEMISATVSSFIDNFVSTPLLYFPFFHIMTGMALDHASLGECMQSYKRLWIQENESSMALYIPTQLANFAVVPPKWRAPVLFTVDFCWAIVWALLLTPHPEAATDMAAAADSAASVAAAAAAAPPVATSAFAFTLGNVVFTLPHS